jgi:hypothetical protein
MASCSTCSQKVCQRNGGRNKYFLEYCSRFCYEVAQQELSSKVDSLFVNCSMCGQQFEITNIHNNNTQHSHLCSSRCRQRKDTIFGRKSQKKYNILMMLKLNGKLSSSDLATRISQAFPSLSRINPSAIGGVLRPFVQKGWVKKEKMNYELVYDVPLEHLASLSLID